MLIGAEPIVLPQKGAKSRTMKIFMSLFLLCALCFSGCLYSRKIEQTEGANDPCMPLPERIAEAKVLVKEYCYKISNQWKAFANTIDIEDDENGNIIINRPDLKTIPDDFTIRGIPYSKYEFHVEVVYKADKPKYVFTCIPPGGTPVPSCGSVLIPPPKNMKIEPTTFRLLVDLELGSVTRPFNPYM